MAMRKQSHSDQEVTRMTIGFPVVKHKQLKAISALLGVPMKEFILNCVIEKLESRELLKTLEEERELEAFDRGMKSIQEEGYDTLEEVKLYLGIVD